jgi:hypothetical protein
MMTMPWGPRPTVLPVASVALRYALIIFASLLLASFAYYLATIGRRPPQLLGKHFEQKVKFYESHADEFNLVFLGDSRTYCGIHPDLLDPLLSTRSINLATMALWLPLQYAMIQDILPSIAPGTTVVWSIGHQNVISELPVDNIYPIGLHALQLYLWGVRNPGLFDNFAAFNPALALYHHRGKLRQWLLKAASRPVRGWHLIPPVHAEPAVTYPAPPAPDDGLDVAAETQRLADYYGSDPRVAAVNPVIMNGRIVAVTLSLAHGSAYWIELDTDFFRASQAKDGVSFATAQIPAYPDPGLLQIVEATLEEFQQRGIHVVINEMQEAPHAYGDAGARDSYHRWLVEGLRPILIRHRVPLVGADFSKLNDDDYFDYNHLNSQGITKFTPLLAAQLAPLLPARPPPE